MKSKSPSAMELFILAAIIAVLFAMLLPAFVKAPSKHAPIRTPSGIAGCLLQVRMASMDYGVREGKAPSSLDDLEGITVRNSKGERIPFSIKALEQELGTNVSTVKYFPDFRALEFGTLTGDEIVLAYVPEFNKTGFCQVIYRSGKIQRVRLPELEKKIQQLKVLLEATRSAPVTNEQDSPATNQATPVRQ